MAYFNNPNDPNFPFTSITAWFEECPLPTQQPVVDQSNGQVHFQNQLLPVNQPKIQVPPLPDNDQGIVSRYHHYQGLTSGAPGSSTTVGQAANFGKHRGSTLVDSSSFQDHDQPSWPNYRWPGVARQPQYEHVGSSCPAVSFAGNMTASGSSMATNSPAPLLGG